MASSDGELLRRLPRVLRARDYHLYLEGGKRLTDLWLSGGRALLGHKPPRVLGELKNTAERGLFVSFPHPMERRFIKALEEFFPGRAFRLYLDSGALCRALESAGFTAGLLEDPAYGDGPLLVGPLSAEQLSDGKAANRGGDSQLSDGSLSGGNISDGNLSVGTAAKRRLCRWRPFLDPPDNASVLIPVLPWPLGPEVLVLEKSLEAAFPPGDLIPPVLLAPAARAMHDLAAAIKTKAPNRGKSPNCGGKRYPKLEKALAKSIWRRRGIYLTVNPGMEGELYEALFKKFLEGGFLLPPSPRAPLILPPSMSAGEESKLAGLLS